MITLVTKLDCGDQGSVLSGVSLFHKVVFLGRSCPNGTFFLINRIQREWGSFIQVYMTWQVLADG